MLPRRGRGARRQPGQTRRWMPAFGSGGMAWVGAPYLRWHSGGGPAAARGNAGAWNQGRRRVDSNHCMEPCGPLPYLLATPPRWCSNTTPHGQISQIRAGIRPRGRSGRISRSPRRGEVLERADRHDLGSCAARRGSSSLPFPTKGYCRQNRPRFTCLSVSGPGQRSGIEPPMRWQEEAPHWRIAPPDLSRAPACPIPKV